MEVKSVYMDLNEGVKRGNVWRLESEAFKKPIEIKIGFENKELDEFQSKVDGLREELNSKQYQLDRMQEKDADLQNGIRITQEEVMKNKDNINYGLDKLDEQTKELNQLYKVIADAKNTIEMQSGTILFLQDKVKELEKKTTKQPSVFHDKCFISGHESSGLGMFNLPDGDYLMIMKTKVGEHNEYVINEDGLFMDKIHVEGQHYIPFYKLEGGTELDTPTATIYYDLVFIPI